MYIYGENEKYIYIYIQGQSGSELVVPDEYREGLLRRLAATGAPLEEAVRGLFRGRDFHGGLRGMPGDVQHIRATLVSDGFFGFVCVCVCVCVFVVCVRRLLRVLPKPRIIYMNT